MIILPKNETICLRSICMSKEKKVKKKKKNKKNKNKKNFQSMLNEIPPPPPFFQL